MTSQNPPVVVGLDLDAPSSASSALRFAARAARARRTDIELIHGSASQVLAGTVPGRVASEEATQSGRLALDRARRYVWDTIDATVRVATVSSGESGESALLAASERASLVVLQRHEGTVLDRLLLGSTTSVVAAQAHCPVVVVRAGDELAHTGGIAVGVDQRGHSREAVSAAAEEASWWEVPLTAVQAWQAPLDSPPYVGYVPADDPERRFARDEAQRSLAEAVAGLSDRYPDLQVGEELIHGDAVAALIHVSSSCGLVVVGRHTSLHVGSMGLGSVARSLLANAQCPVMVVPPGRELPDRRR